MTVAAYAGEPEPRSEDQRPEPRSMTLADLCVFVAGVALAMTIPSRASGLPPFLSPRMSLLLFLLLAGLRLTMGFGLVLALVVAFRHGRYGGPVRPVEWLALGVASLGLSTRFPTSTRRSMRTTPPWARPGSTSAWRAGCWRRRRQWGSSSSRPCWLSFDVERAEARGSHRC